MPTKRKINPIKYSTALYVVVVFLMLPGSICSQSDEAQIRSEREASNIALKADDLEGVLSTLTDDVLITTGAGTLLCGKVALEKYIEAANQDQPMYWIRSPEELLINAENGLAWESGIWNGYLMTDQENKNSIVHGKYTAMWTTASGQWKIKSQLFVTLD